jgi:nitroreductase
MSLFRTRRSLKPLAMDPARPLPREVLLELLEDAHWAPTHGLNQPWRFHVFATPVARARLGDALQSLYDAITPPDQRDDAKRAKLGDAPRHAPVVVALLSHFDPGGRIPEWEELAATACAAQNLMLSAHARGLGSFWSSPPVACSPEFVRWLGLETATHRAIGLLYLGHPRAGSPAPRSVRTPLAHCVAWHEA